MRWPLRSKIHKTTVTRADVDYIGSTTSGSRLGTYIIAGERSSGVIMMNGAAAHLIHTGEEIIGMGFESTGQSLNPKLILVDERNRFVRYLNEREGC